MLIEFAVSALLILNGLPPCKEYSLNNPLISNSYFKLCLFCSNEGFFLIFKGSFILFLFLSEGRKGVVLVFESGLSVLRFCSFPEFK